MTSPERIPSGARVADDAESTMSARRSPRRIAYSVLAGLFGLQLLVVSLLILGSRWDSRLTPQRRSTAPAVKGATPVSAASRIGPQRLRSRSDTIRLVVAGAVFAG